MSLKSLNDFALSLLSFIMLAISTVSYGEGSSSKITVINLLGYPLELTWETRVDGITYPPGHVETILPDSTFSQERSGLFSTVHSKIQLVVVGPDESKTTIYDSGLIQKIDPEIIVELVPTFDAASATINVPGVGPIRVELYGRSLHFY